MPINFSDLDVNAATAKFTDFCIKTADEYFPICKKNIGLKRIKSPWLNKPARRCIDLKIKFYNCCRKLNIDKYWDIFRLFDEVVNLLLKVARENYFKNYFNSCKKSSKKTWNKINELFSERKSHSSKLLLKNINGELISNPSDVANLFNDYFIGIPSDLSFKLPPPKNDYSELCIRNPLSLFFHPATASEVFNVIQSIKSKSSINDIPLQMIKQSLCFSVGISELFNHVISNGNYPDQLKIATVVPIFKSGSRYDIKNYRPISLLPVLDKIFERLIINRLLSFLIKNNIISDRQFGYISGSNTQLAIFDLLSTVIPALKDKEFAIAIFADLSRAFDCVDTEVLIRKLYAYGIRGLSSSLLSSFLTNRHQQVKIDNAHSKLSHIMMGVPQGSSLGPLLFLLYMNELPRLCNINIECIMYADDTTLVSRGRDINLTCSYLSSFMSVFIDWLRFNKLTLNINKTKVILFTTKTSIQKPIIYADHTPIACVDSHKYLGIEFDSKLNYNFHIRSVKSKLSMYVGISNKISSFFCLSSAKNFYYSHVYSQISYCIVIWGGWLQLSKYNNLSNKLNKIICNMFWRFSTPYTCKFCILKKMKLLKLFDIYKLNLVMLIFKCYKSPTNRISSYIEMQPRLLDHFILNAHEFNLPYFRINSVKFNFHYQALLHWNNLPINIKNAKSIGNFKKLFIDFVTQGYCEH